MKRSPEQAATRPSSTAIRKPRTVDDRPPEPIDPVYRDLILQGLEDVRKGDMASDEEVEAIFARFKS